MESQKNPLVFLLLALALLLSFAAHIGHGESSRPTPTDEIQIDLRRKRNSEFVTWCIAKPSTDNESLKRNIDYSCGQKGVDCRPIQPGGACFLPDNLMSHASYAMNLFYKSAGKNFWNCHFNSTGLIVSLEDPSLAPCYYPA
ncbi:hypothetical protein Dsin_025697 [Dipteronia sinensis]|uniref:X8 domain-containing protein n=1 Tax=Dipteronia sinensis TaxID=43782 RepID=A0AAE0DX75_9ROSI|nr:hypothetical protein Dsin_025697 [Dipteronia sinensis]